MKLVDKSIGYIIGLYSSSLVPAGPNRPYRSIT